MAIVYTRITHSDGTSYVRWSIAWDAERFLASQREQHANAKKPEDRATVALIDEDEYRAEKWPNAPGRVV